MPRKPKRPCSFPGCPELTEGRFCEEHEKQENRRCEKYGRDPAVRRRYGRAWKRMTGFVVSFLLKNNMIFLRFCLTKAEIIGLTWSDIDMKNKQVSITHQLICKNLGEGSRLCVTTPKTEAGIRDITMTASVRKAFEKQREYQFMMGIDRDYEVTV